MESSSNWASFKSSVGTPVNTLFNWTSFMSRRATFQVKYVHTFIRKHPLDFNDVISQFEAYNKTRSFCWMVTNCGSTWTPRAKLGVSLVEKLSDKVHMHGSALRRCLRQLTNKTVDHGMFSLGGDIEKERQKRIKPCKFYFAFENSNCTDYVTEKFENALRAFAIPIVNGFRESYERILPGSFIQVKDLGSMEKLARYLDYLLQNRTAFMEYHKWRTHTSLDAEHNSKHHQGQCRLCRKLFSFFKDDRRPTMIDNLAKEMKSLQTCDSNYSSFE